MTESMVYFHYAIPVLEMEVIGLRSLLPSSNWKTLENAQNTRLKPHSRRD
jgi:hypothetical protein